MENIDILREIEKSQVRQNTLYGVIGRYRSLPTAIEFSIREEAESLDKSISKLKNKLKSRL